MGAGGISIHAVDVAHGRIARGLGVSLHRMDETPSAGESEIARGFIGDNGLFDDPTARGEGVSAGTWEVRFAIGDYFRAQGIEAPFLDIVPFRFTIRDAREHFHLPMKFTPFGFSLYRGA